MKKEKFIQSKYINSYKKEHYDRIRFIVPKGKRQVIRDFATQKGMSAGQLIVSALEAEYNIDLSKSQE